MKPIKIVFFIIVIVIITISACKKSSQDNNQPSETSDYNTTATANITYPNIYSMTVTGTTHATTNGNIFTSVSNFTLGPNHYDNIEVDGSIQNGQVSFTNKQIMLITPVQGTSDTIREEVIISTGNVNISSDPITGTGNIILRILPDTLTDRGTITYTLIKNK